MFLTDFFIDAFPRNQATVLGEYTRHVIVIRSTINYLFSISYVILVDFPSVFYLNPYYVHACDAYTRRRSIPLHE